MENHNDNLNDNVYALDVKGDPIHISQAKSGRNGYYCMGCKRDMQAVKTTIANRMSYFRHDPKAVKNQPKCTYRDETYRHQLAKRILETNKRIKVPAVYKYPPKGIEGRAMLLQKEQFIDAYSVKTEVEIYEDENCEVHYGPNPGVKDRFLVIKPDVVFFDHSGIPILLIEIIATHKPSMDKLLKLKRLRIDAVQVSIPKDTPENIEKTFHTTAHTKWIYNNVEETTPYIRVSDPDSEGVLSVDEIQRRLFEEDFRCRSAQVKTLIRRINRCLESQPYRDAEQGIRSAISRVEGNTKDYRRRLGQLRSERKAGIYLEFEERFKSIERERERIDREENELYDRTEKEEGKYQDLERRYLAKRDQLEREEQNIQANIEYTIKQGGSPNSEHIYERTRIESEKRRLQEKIESVISDIKEVIRRRNALPDIYRESEGDVVTSHEDSLRRERAEIDRITKEEEGLPDFFEEDGKRLENEFGRIRSEITEQIKKRDAGGDSELSKSIRRSLETRELLRNFEETLLANRRVKQAQESLKSGAYKNWTK